MEEEEEHKLWLEYKKTHNPAIRDKIITQYHPLVKYVAGRMSANMPSNVEFDDLVCYGVFGLMDAIERYDPERNTRFKTYAVTRIKGAIFDELRSIDHVSRLVRQRGRDLATVVQNLEANLGRKAAAKEIAEAMDISLKEYHSLVLKISSSAILSLDDVWYTSDDNDKVSMLESIEAPASLQPDVITENSEVRRIVIDVVKELPEKEKKVLILYYYENLTLREIGKVLEVTESRVSQLHTKAIALLRTKLLNARKGVF
ncbi:MAG: RNA polymerase sigma factor WhiG [Spirochaetaceae bacterium]|nr:RNA polymerase sigma factor WhiG [Spirochaetaceae bacterium]